MSYIQSGCLINDTQTLSLCAHKGDKIKAFQIHPGLADKGPKVLVLLSVW